MRDGENDAKSLWNDDITEMIDVLLEQLKNTYKSIKTVSIFLWLLTELLWPVFDFL